MEKRTVVAIGLIIAVIGLWQMVVVPRFVPTPEPAPAPAPATAEAPSPAAVPVPVPPSPAPPEGAPAPPAPVPLADAERFEFGLADVTAAFSNLRGGTVESWRLPGYAYGRDQKDAEAAPLAGQPLEMVRPAPGSAPLAFSFSDPGTQAAFEGPWAAERGAGELTFRRGDEHGLRVSRTLRLPGRGHLLEVEVTIENLGSAPRPAGWETTWGPGIDRHLPENERGEEEAVALAGGSLESLKAKKIGDRSDVGQISWVAVGNRYFVAALAPREGVLAGFARRQGPEGLEIGVRSGAFTLMPGQSATWRLSTFLGPKDREVLAAAGAGLERSVDYGWFSWLAIPFLAILKFCHGFLRSWGLAIFALTLLVKAALFPISFKMFRSMKKMQDVAPKVQALKSKYKNDPQGLQRETMEIYRKHGVNPVAGCLPMLVQIPVFFALYRVLYSAIELRGAGFLYIPDLSLKDPYYVAPILMGATMLIQQRLTPTADPKQARLMMFMPVVFTAMFINFSSGLVLYFLFSNVLSITEQKLFRAIAARRAGGAPTPPAAEPKGKKRRQR